MHRWILVACLLTVPACVHPAPPTPVAATADLATKFELSCDMILHAAQAAHAQTKPNSTEPYLSTETLVQIALAGDRLGHLGVSLGNGLSAYSALKASGQDLTQERAYVQAMLAAATDALADVGRAVPPGTLKAIDDAVTQSLSLLADIRSAVSL